MTAQEAAKACMQRVARCIDDVHGEDGPEWMQIERGFTEIISQVTPPSDLLGQIPGPVACGGSAHLLDESQAEKRRRQRRGAHLFPLASLFRVLRRKSARRCWRNSGTRTMARYPHSGHTSYEGVGDYSRAEAALATRQLVG